MKNFWKYFGYCALGVTILAYAGFLFVLPNALDLNKFKPDLQKIVKEQTSLNLDFQNAKVITTPLLGIGIKADDISIKLPDESILFSADNIKTRVAIPSIFLLTAKVSCLEINKPFINLEIADNEDYKIVKIVENILNAGKEQELEKAPTVIEEEKGFKFNPAWIRIKVSNVNFYNYKILVNDLTTKHYLDLHGEELNLAYNNGKTAKLKTYAKLFSDNNKNITANININTCLPKPAPKLDDEDDKAERIDIPFVNPVSIYRNYDLKANLDTKLRIRNHRKNVTSYGFFNIENITMKVSQLQLPESYLRAKTFGNNITIDTDIYPIKEQNIKLFGKIKYGKHPKMDLNIQTAEIQFNDLLTLAKAFLDSLQIKNELAQFRAEGILKANCHVKTNFKKLISNGFVNITNGGMSVRNLGQIISQANINLNLENNVLDIKDSSLLINNAPLYIDGKIDKKSVADIEIKADKLPLPSLFNAFAPKNIREAYNFKSGNASLDLAITGELKKAVAAIKFGLENLNFADRNNSFRLTNKTLFGEFFCNSKTIIGKVDNKDFSFSLPKTNSQIIAPDFNVQIAEKNIIIKENSILLNDKTNIKYSGKVIDYEKIKSINFIAQGLVNTEDLIKLIGKELEPFINHSGDVPVKLTLDGNKHKQTIFAQILANKNNFLTPIDFSEIVNKDTSLQSVIDLKPGRIKIKKTGLFTRSVTVDEKGNEVINLDEIVGVDGTIEGNRINLLKITMPKSLQGKFHIFPQSDFTVKGRAFVLGETSSPRFRGGFTITNTTIPEILLTLRTANLQFKGHEAHFDVQDLILNGSDIQTNGIISLIPDSVLNILNLNVSSRYFNVDKLMAVSERAMKYIPAGDNTTSTNTKKEQIIPVKIHTGSLNMTRIISGNIDIRNTYSRLGFENNILDLKNLRTNIFNGNVSGNISVNPITMFLDIKVKGKNIDVEKAMLDAAGMKDMLSGNADFDANIKLKGLTMQEQMQSLLGKVDFTVKDGQFGPFGKLENLIIAENIRESQLFQTALGGVISGLTTIDTTHFAELNGSLGFEDGICHINPITSLGNILSLHIFGDFDLLRNYADMKVRARMASLVSNLLGPLSAINPVNLLNNAASLNVITAKAFSIFCEMVPEEEIEILPSFSNSYVDNAATKFQLVVRGDVAKPFTLVKSFKWLATKTEYDTAVDYVNSLPEPIEGSQATNIADMISEVEAEKRTIKYKLQHMFKKTEEENIKVESEDFNQEIKKEVDKVLTE